MLKVGPCGSQTKGEIFDDGYHSTVRQLLIYYNSSNIDAIQIEYDDNGSSFWSEKHGFSCNRKDTIKLDYPEEFLTSVHGHYEKLWSIGTSIKSLTFTSNTKSYGPYGNDEGESFSIHMPRTKIVGFHGRYSDTFFRAIGVYLKRYENEKQHPSTLVDHTCYRLVLPRFIKKDDDEVSRQNEKQHPSTPVDHTCYRLVLPKFIKKDDDEVSRQNEKQHPSKPLDRTCYRLVLPKYIEKDDDEVSRQNEKQPPSKPLDHTCYRLVLPKFIEKDDNEVSRQNEKQHPSKPLDHTCYRLVLPGRPAEYPYPTTNIEKDDDKVSKLISNYQVNGTKGDHNRNFPYQCTYNYQYNYY